MVNPFPGKTSYGSIAVLLCLVFSTLAVNAQNQKPDQKPDEVVRVDTSLVQTDVSVLDQNGHFVKGLTAGQIQLQVNKKTREILFFEDVVAGSASE